MSKITISFEGHINSTAQLIPALTKLLAPAPLNITIEDSAIAAPVKRAPKKEAPTSAAVPAVPATSGDDAEKKAQAKREAAKRFAEKKKAEKAATAAASDDAPMEQLAHAKPAKPAKPAKAAEDTGEVTMTTLRAAAMKLPKTKLVPILEELGVAKLTELADEDLGKALALLEASNG